MRYETQVYFDDILNRWKGQSLRKAQAFYTFLQTNPELDLQGCSWNPNLKLHAHKACVTGDIIDGRTRRKNGELTRTTVGGKIVKGKVYLERDYVDFEPLVEKRAFEPTARIPQLVELSVADREAEQERLADEDIPF